MNAVISNGVLAFSAETADEPAPTTTTTNDDGLRSDLTEYDVSPGLEGFLVTFFVAVCLFLLLLGMTRRLRKVKHKGGANQQVTATFDGEGPKLRSHEARDSEPTDTK